jgi:hypothetical protein
MNRTFWFLAGAGAGVYAVSRARRTVEAFTPDGLRDRLSALSLGASLLTTEVRTHMSVKEQELRERLVLTSPGEGSSRSDRQLEAGPDSRVEAGPPRELSREGDR